MAESRKLQVPDAVVDAIRDQFETHAPIEPNRGSVEPMVRHPRIQNKVPVQGPDAAQAHHDESQEAEKLKRQLIGDWRLVKRARFNAAKRLRKRHEAGQLTFAISGIYGFLVPLFLLQFDSYLSSFAATVFSFGAAVAGALSFTIAMMYQQKDFKSRAAQLDECGLKINSLYRSLRATPIARREDLRQFIHHYNDILGRCENHDEIDFEMALMTRNPKNLSEQELAQWKWDKWVLRFQLYRQTYTVCAIVWLLPIVIGCVIWWTLAPR